jgi:beta-mannosidase
VVVEVVVERVAWGVRLEVPGFVPDDDAFDVVPGWPRRVVLRPARPDARFEGGRVTALNLIGERAIGATDVRA